MARGPRLRVKLLTGTTAAVENSGVVTAHSLDDAQIVSWVASVQNDADTKIGENHLVNSDFEFHTTIEPSGFFKIFNANLNSASILSKPFSVLIFYIG